MRENREFGGVIVVLRLHRTKVRIAFAGEKAAARNDCKRAASHDRDVVERDLGGGFAVFRDPGETILKARREGGSWRAKERDPIEFNGQSVRSEEHTSELQ